MSSFALPLSWPRFSRRALPTAVAVALLFGAASAARAQLSGSAFGEKVTLSFAPLIGSPVQLSSGPWPQVSQSSSSAFSTDGEMASVAVSNPLLGSVLASGLMVVTTEAAYSPVSVTSSSSLQSPRLQLGNLVSLFGLQAEQFRSTAQLTGCGDDQTSIGTTRLVDLTLGGTLGSGLTAPVDPAPNTELLSIPGIRLILNEQILTVKGGQRTLEVNAAHLSLNAIPLAGLGLLTGDVILGQAKAQINCAAIPLGATDLALSATAPSVSTAGQPLTYRVTIRNQGEVTATNTVFTATLPSGISAETVVPSQGGCTKSPVVCTLRNIEPGDTATVRVVVRPSKPGSLTARLSATSAGDEIEPADNSVSITTSVEAETPGELAERPDETLPDDLPEI